MQSETSNKIRTMEEMEGFREETSEEEEGSGLPQEEEAALILKTCLVGLVISSEVEVEKREVEVALMQVSKVFLKRALVEVASVEDKKQRGNSLRILKYSSSQSKQNTKSMREEDLFWLFSSIVKVFKRMKR